LDAYFEEELYDNLTYCIQNPKAADFEIKEIEPQKSGKSYFLTEV